MAVIESNITNASNPDYSVESVGFQTIAGPNGAGAGVEVMQPTRAEDPLLTNQINDTQGQQSYQQAFAQIATLAQQIVAPSSGDLGSALQSVFNAFSSLSADPQDPTTRTSVITALSQFAQTDQNMSSSLYSTAVTQLDSVSPLITQINAASSQVAQLNTQITAASAAGQSTAALEDQRDGAINQLASLVGATADANGNVTVGGVPLVSGSSALTLSTTGSGTSMGLSVSLANGALPLNVSQVGGQLGGVLSGAQATLNLQTQVNNFAQTVAGSLNNISVTGWGLDGSTGNALFSIPNGSGAISINSALTVQNLPAASSSAGVPGDGSNAAALAAVANQQNLFSSDPTNTPGEELTEITSNFGTLVQNASNGQTQAANALQSLTQMKGQITGVSINDQLTQLLQYQNMLQASGQAVQIACNDITFLIQNVTQ
jgi:flagellar hook-associated protein 1